MRKKGTETGEMGENGIIREVFRKGKYLTIAEKGITFYGVGGGGGGGERVTF